LARKQADRSLAGFDEAIRLDPNNPAAYLSRGDAWFGKHDYDKAIADYTEAIRLDPNNAGAHRARGYAWTAKGEPDKALVDYKEAARLANPRQAAPAPPGAVPAP